MTDDISLPWLELVDSVRRGDFEPIDADGIPRFLYSKARNVFVSDPYVVGQIMQARGHDYPFMLEGEFGTGKNIFLELVAADANQECVDENVDGTQDEMLEKFFSPSGMVEQHPNSLFHFDLMQNAVGWPVFLDKVHQLARNGLLHRTDGAVIRDLRIRVVAGTTVDLAERINSSQASSAKYLYDYLATNQRTRMPRLKDQRHRIPIILCETVAAQVLDSRSNISASEATAVERVPDEVLVQLQDYEWPDGFYEIVRLVRASLTEGRWTTKGLKPRPMEKLKIFVSHSSQDSAKIAELHNWLKANNVDPWVSVNKILPGQDWELEILRALKAADVVIVCLSRAATTRTGYLQAEIKRALDLVDRVPEGQIYLIPLRLEDCAPPSRLLKYQYVDFFEPEGKSKLLLALRNRAATLGKAPPGSHVYAGRSDDSATSRSELFLLRAVLMMSTL